MTISGGSLTIASRGVLSLSDISIEDNETGDRWSISWGRGDAARRGRQGARARLAGEDGGGFVSSPGISASRIRWPDTQGLPAGLAPGGPLRATPTDSTSPFGRST